MILITNTVPTLLTTIEDPTDPRSTPSPATLTTNPMRAFTMPGRGPLRTTRDAEGNFWFVAQDVCSALDLTNTARALSRLDDDEKGITTVNTLGGIQVVSTVSESGLYSLILRSRKPEAKAFKRWITHSVLPAIRADGVYVLGEEQLLSSATPEQLQERLREIKETAARGIEAKAVRGLNAMEERAALGETLKFLNRGRRRRPRLTLEQVMSGAA